MSRLRLASSRYTKWCSGQKEWRSSELELYLKWNHAFLDNFSGCKYGSKRNQRSPNNFDENGEIHNVLFVADWSWIKWTNRTGKEEESFLWIIAYIHVHANRRDSKGMPNWKLVVVLAFLRFPESREEGAGAQRILLLNVISFTSCLQIEKHGPRNSLRSAPFFCIFLRE